VVAKNPTCPQIGTEGMGGRTGHITIKIGKLGKMEKIQKKRC